MDNNNLPSYKTNYVYLVKEDGTHYYKIGRTNNLTQRLSTLQTGNPRRLILVDIIDCVSKQQSIYVEQHLHSKLISLHVKGEWFEESKEADVIKQFGLLHQSQIEALCYY